jgi:hypothetical protein
MDYVVGGFSGSGKIVFLQQRIQVLGDMYRRVITICMGRSKILPHLGFQCSVKTFNDASFGLLVIRGKEDLSYVTFQGNSEIWSHKTGGCLIQV